MESSNVFRLYVPLMKEPASMGPLTRFLRARADFRSGVASLLIWFILLRRLQAADGRARHVNLDLTRHLQLDHVVLETHDRAVYATRRDDPVTGLQFGQHLLNLASLLLLGTDNKEIPDDKQRPEKQQELRYAATRAGVSRQSNPVDQSSLDQGRAA